MEKEQINNMSSKEFFAYLETVKEDTESVRFIISWFKSKTKRSILNWVLDVANGYTKPSVPKDLYQTMMEIDLSKFNRIIMYSLLVQINHLVHLAPDLFKVLDRMYEYYKAIDQKLEEEMRKASATIQSIYTNWDGLRKSYGLTTDKDPSGN